VWPQSVRVRSYTQGVQFGTRGVQKQTDRAENRMKPMTRVLPSTPAVEVPVPGPVSPFGLGVPLARTRRRREPRSTGLSPFLTTEKPTPCEKSDCQVYGILVVARRFTYCGAGKCRFRVRRKWRRVFEATGLTQSRRASLAEEAKLQSMSSSLSRFSGWRSRSLSLGEGLTDSTGARDGTRADGVLDRGRRRKFSF
jgi:hypothetical protein